MKCIILLTLAIRMALGNVFKLRLEALTDVEGPYPQQIYCEVVMKKAYGSVDYRASMTAQINTPNGELYDYSWTEGNVWHFWLSSSDRYTQLQVQCLDSADKKILDSVKDLEGKTQCSGYDYYSFEDKSFVDASWLGGDMRRLQEGIKPTARFLTACRPSPQYLDYDPAGGIAVTCGIAPSTLACASNDGLHCLWDQYGNPEPFSELQQVHMGTMSREVSCPGWKSKSVSDPCKRMGCYDDLPHYLDHGLGVAAQCGEEPGYISCASDNGIDCRWGQYKDKEEGYTPFENVPKDDMGPMNATYECQINAVNTWPSATAGDACAKMGCYASSAGGGAVSADIDGQDILPFYNNFYMIVSGLSLCCVIIGLYVWCLMSKLMYKSKGYLACDS
eukprot:188152_1